MGTVDPGKDIVDKVGRDARRLSPRRLVKHGSTLRGTGARTETLYALNFSSGRSIARYVARAKKRTSRNPQPQ